MQFCLPWEKGFYSGGRLICLFPRSVLLYRYKWLVVPASRLLPWRRIDEKCRVSEWDSNVIWVRPVAGRGDTDTPTHTHTHTDRVALRHILIHWPCQPRSQPPVLTAGAGEPQDPPQLLFTCCSLCKVCPARTTLYTGRQRIYCTYSYVKIESMHQLLSYCVAHQHCNKSRTLPLV